jgi:protein TonB
VPVDDVPIYLRAGITRPEILDRTEPRYTELARRSNVQGTVIVEAVIDEQGRVRDVKVLKGLPLGLDQSAVDAVRRWLFRPAMMGDRPVKVFYSLTVTFRIR